jgi:hypothetical protein
MVDEARTKQQGLQQAASVIFALVAVVPLLIFAWTLHTLGAIRSLQAQLSLGLALGVALLGFWMFRSMLARMAEVVQALTAAVEQASRSRRAAMPVAAPAPTPAAVAHEADGVAAPATAGVSVAAVAPAPAMVKPAPSATPFTAPAPAAPFATSRLAAGPVARPASGGVAGIGKIRELTEVVRTMDALWYREATAYLGQRVQISVANSREPLIGTLAEATPDGLILEQPDGAVPVAYGRVTSIDRLH